MLHCRFVILLKMIVDIKVANVMLEFVDIKVANRIDSFEVAKFCWWWILRSGRLILVIWWNFEFLTFFLILIGYFIWFSALLCCFELLMYWWRIDDLNRVDIKLFLCGIEVFECFEELFFAESFIWWFQCLASSRKVFIQFVDVLWCSVF